MEKGVSVGSRRSVLVPIILILILMLSAICMMMAYRYTFRGALSEPSRVQTTIIEQVYYPVSSREFPVTGEEDKWQTYLESYSRFQRPNPVSDRVVRPRLFSVSKMSLGPGEDPEMTMYMCDIARRWGYACEQHTARTDDGYLLGVHRIKAPAPHTSARPYPVFLQHGLLCSSADWANNLPNTSLAFILADNGYDVWLGNFRGNTYSRNHTTIDPNSREFWRFTWDEMASKDLPAMLNYVLNATGNHDLFYVGHSQGTLTAFAEFSRNRDLAQRVRMFFALAPVTTVGHTTDKLFRAITPYIHQAKALAYRLGYSGELMPRGIRVVDWMNEHICNRAFTEFVCEDVMWVAGGINTKQLNESRIPVYISQTPAGTSIENIEHFAQMVQSGLFQMYDFGSEAANVQHYGQTTPPLYNVSQLRTPLAIFWGGQDWLADQEDVKQLIAQLPRIDYNKFVDSYDHLSFLWALSSPNIIYNDILKLMNKTLSGAN